MEHKLGGGNRLGDVSPIRTVHARSELGLVLQQIFSLFSPWEFSLTLKSCLFSYGSLRSTENLQNNLESAQWKNKGDTLQINFKALGI